MKGRIAAVALIGTLAGCGTAAGAGAPTTPISTVTLVSASYGPPAAVAALKRAAQGLMDASIDGDTSGVLAHLDRDCDWDRKASLNAAAAIRRMAHGVHPKVKSVFVSGYDGAVWDWTVPTNAPQALKRYVRRPPAARTNDWTVDSHGHWVQETSCVPVRPGHPIGRLA